MLQKRCHCFFAPLLFCTAAIYFAPLFFLRRVFRISLSNFVQGERKKRSERLTVSMSQDKSVRNNCSFAAENLVICFAVYLNFSNQHVIMPTICSCITANDCFSYFDKRSVGATRHTAIKTELSQFNEV